MHIWPLRRASNNTEVYVHIVNACRKDMATWLTADTNFAVASFAGNRRTPSRRIPDMEESRSPPRRRCHRCQRTPRPVSPTHRSACRGRQRPSTTPRQPPRRLWRSRRRRRQSRRIGARCRSPPQSSLDSRQPSIRTHTLHTCLPHTLLTSWPLQALNGPAATKTVARSARPDTSHL